MWKPQWLLPPLSWPHNVATVVAARRACGDLDYCEALKLDSVFGKVEEPAAWGSVSQNPVDNALRSREGRMLELVWRERNESKSCKAGYMQG